MIDKLEFIKKFADKCKTNSAAVFLGAGMSVDAGLPSWKQLFQPLAEKLKIDIENTNYQIYDIAQFYANTFGKNDKGINVPDKNEIITFLIELSPNPAVV